MPSSATFSVTLQTNILSTEISDFLKQIIFHSVINSVIYKIKQVDNKLTVSPWNELFSHNFVSEFDFQPFTMDNSSDQPANSVQRKFSVGLGTPRQ